jgi:hypothetical protein
VVCCAIENDAAHQRLSRPFNAVKRLHAVTPTNVCVDGSA